MLGLNTGCDTALVKRCNKQIENIPYIVNIWSALCMIYTRSDSTFMRFQRSKNLQREQIIKNLTIFALQAETN